MSNLVIRELMSADEMHSIFPLIQQLNPEIDEPLFSSRLTSMREEGGYRCIASYRDERMVGVAGFWVGTQLWCGKYVEPDNVVVDREERSGGIGGLMMDWIEAEAQRLGCENDEARGLCRTRPYSRILSKEGLWRARYRHGQDIGGQWRSDP